MRHVGPLLEVVVLIALLLWCGAVWLSAVERELWRPEDIIIVGSLSVLAAVLIVSAPVIIYKAIKAFVVHWWTH